jgi:hypothetical protein
MRTGSAEDSQRLTRAVVFQRGELALWIREMMQYHFKRFQDEIACPTLVDRHRIGLSRQFRQRGPQVLLHLEPDEVAENQQWQ